MVSCLVVKLRQIIVWVYLAIIFVAAVNPFPFDTDKESDCHRCNKEYSQITDKFARRSKNKSRHWCAAYAQFIHCHKELESRCRADLNFQGGRSVIEATIKREYNCERYHRTNDTLKIITEVEHSPMDQPKCKRLTLRPSYKICGLFGDPHLWTFDNKRHTCSVPGAWPLIDNRHMSVQVTNIPLNRETRATATSEVTVTVKEWKSKCISGKIYQAKSSLLPAVFSDGTNSTNEGSCSTTVHQISPTRVMIDICPHKTKIYIRRVNNYLTVHLRVPKDLMIRETIGLCQRGCPRIQQMNMDRRPRINNLIASSYDKNTVSKRVRRERRRRARKLCRAAKLSGFYYKSCLFDVMTSNDDRFVNAARTAMDDFREINIDDDGKPIVNFTARVLQRWPTKKSRKHRTKQLTTTPLLITPLSPRSSAPVRTTHLPCYLLLLFTVQRLLDR